MRKGEKFVWMDKGQESFKELKRRLVSALILTLSSGSGGFQIYSDASKKGLGCVLMQHGKVIAYASRQLKLIFAKLKGLERQKEAKTIKNRQETGKRQRVKSKSEE
ncbi:putative reverse transcriptase domain-containing protein [Tanacetum coccineum]